MTWWPAFRIVDTDDGRARPGYRGGVEGYRNKLDQELKIEIGTTETALDSRRATVRGEEAAIGYTVFKGAKLLINAIDAKLMATDVIDYVAARKEIAPVVEGRIVLQ